MKVQWFCEHHQDTRADTYCETHQKPICKECSLNGHVTCGKKDIQDEITERIYQLTCLIQQGEAKHEEIKKHDAHFNRKADSVDSHLSALADEVVSTVAEETQKVCDEKERHDEAINREIDEEIATLNARRKERLEQNRTNAIRKLETVEAEKQELTKDLQRMKAEFKKEFEKVANAQAHLVETIGDAYKLISEEVELLTDFNSKMHLVHGGVKIDISMKGFEDLASITQEISLVKAKGHGVGKLGRYRLEENGEFPTGLNGSTMLGAIGHDEIAFRIKNNSVHVLNLKEKSNERVLKGKASNRLWSCASLTDGRIVCGTNAAQIHVYDPQWKRILRTINIAFKTKKETLVSVSSDGLVYASILGENAISLFNPQDGGFVKMITVEDSPIHGLLSLPSGNFAVISECSVGKDVCFVEGEGNITNRTHFHDTDDLTVTQDGTNDSIHVISWDRHFHDCTVRKMSERGLVTAESKLTFPARSSYDSSCAVSGSGMLVLHISDKLFVYEQTLQDVATLLK